MFVKNLKPYVICLLLVALAAGVVALVVRQRSGPRDVSSSTIHGQTGGGASASDGSSASASLSTERVATKAPKFKLVADEATWENVIEWFADISGLTYAEGSITPTGSPTLHTPEDSTNEFTIAEIMEILNEALLSRKPNERCFLVRGEITFTFISEDELRNTRPHLVTLDQLDYCVRSEVVMVLIPLTREAAKEVVKDLEPLKSSFGEIAALPPNSIWLLDTASIIRDKILPAIEKIDKKTKGSGGSAGH
jgi:hypothetical protein